MVVERPEVLVLDVNETLLDMEPLRGRFEEVGLPGSAMDTWFASTLRDGFALTAAGGYGSFPDIGADVLRGLLAVNHLDSGPDAVAKVMSGMAELPAHPDVAPGLLRLSEDGVRLVTLANGPSAVAERMLSDAGVLSVVEERLSVDQSGRWKPHPDAYRYAAEVVRVDVSRMALAAAHPWDVDGARRAGLQGYWINRKKTWYPGSFLTPDVEAADLEELAITLETGRG